MIHNNFLTDLKWIGRKEEEEIINIYDDCTFINSI